MRISTTAMEQTIARMAALFAVFSVRAQNHAQDPTLSPHRLHRLLRTMHRLLRAIIMAEVWIAHRAAKARMLADPVWRAQVMADLGGYHAFARWEARRAWCGPQTDLRCIDGTDTGREPRPRKPAVRLSLFCLPPIPRAFQTRQTYDAPWRPYKPSTRSPWDAQIIVSPDEFRAAASRAKSRPTDTPFGFESRSFQNQNKDTPPTPDPP